MPHHKNHKINRIRDDLRNNNEEGENDHAFRHGEEPAGRRPAVDNNPHLWRCCFPGGCKKIEELIDSTNLLTSLRVVCNNEHCDQSNWMHKDCFEEFESSVLAYLRSCGRARSWSEKQRLQNLWTKKGYDLAFKACDCKCGRGHIRKDLDFQPPSVDDTVKKQRKVKKKNEKPQAVLSLTSGQKAGGLLQLNTNHSGNNNNNHHQNSNINHANNAINNAKSIPINNGLVELRRRTDSMDSTGSSPPNSTSSTSSSPVSPYYNGQNMMRKPKFDFFTDQSHAAAGNIFRRRHDLSALQSLSRFKQNAYYIKMEDEGPHGNDDTRNFVLSHLSTYKVTSLNCVLCKCELPVFDKYPLLDGTMFLSPQAYDDRVVQVIWEGRLQFLNSVCIRCMEGTTDVRCCACKGKWDGSKLVIGTMYTYDIFAAMPCCQKRLTCKMCRRAVVDVTRGLSFYSEYSRMIVCPYCKANDFHFIRSLPDTFSIRSSIWN